VVVLERPIVENVLPRLMETDVVVSIMGKVVEPGKVCVELAAVAVPCGDGMLVPVLEGKKYTAAAAKTSTPMTATAASAPTSLLYSANDRMPARGSTGTAIPLRFRRAFRCLF